MSAGKVNMALDDIIGQKKSTRKERKIKPVKRADDRSNQGFQKRRFGGNRQQFSNNRRGSNFNLNRGNRRGGNAPRRGGFNGRNHNRNQDRNNNNRNRLNFNGQNKQRRIQRGNQQSPVKKCRLRISNLAPDVTNQELYEIFSEIGRLKRCGIHWDGLGKSKCTADVEYFTNEDASKAISTYNNAECQGKQLKVEYRDDVLANNYTTRRGIRRKRINIINKPGFQGNNRGNSSGRSRARGRGRGNTRGRGYD